MKNDSKEIQPNENSLSETYFCNFSDNSIQDLAKNLAANNSTTIDLIKAAFEHVRDKIRLGLELYQVKASETLGKGYGACWNKSVLLVALLRANKIPAHFWTMPLNHRFISPAYGDAYKMVNNPFFHGFVKVFHENRWVSLEPALDTSMYQAFWGDLDINWGVDWDGVSDMLLYVEDVVGSPRIHVDIDEAIRRNIDNEPPSPMVIEAYDAVNKETWEKIDARATSKTF